MLIFDHHLHTWLSTLPHKIQQFHPELPSFFLQQPITVREGQTICVRFWRCSNSKKVWYEWAVTAPVCSAIHNPTGRSYTIGL